MKSMLLIGLVALAACGAEGDPLPPGASQDGPGLDTEVGPVPDTQVVGSGPITFQL